MYFHSESSFFTRLDHTLRQCNYFASVVNYHFLVVVRSLDLVLTIAPGLWEVRKKQGSKHLVKNVSE